MTGEEEEEEESEVVHLGLHGFEVIVGTREMRERRKKTYE